MQTEGESVSFTRISHAGPRWHKGGDDGNNHKATLQYLRWKKTTGRRLCLNHKTQQFDDLKRNLATVLCSKPLEVEMHGNIPEYFVQTWITHWIPPNSWSDTAVECWWVLQFCLSNSGSNLRFRFCRTFPWSLLANHEHAFHIWSSQPLPAKKQTQTVHCLCGVRSNCVQVAGSHPKPKTVPSKASAAPPSHSFKKPWSSLCIEIWVTNCFESEYSHRSTMLPVWTNSCGRFLSFYMCFQANSRLIIGNVLVMNLILKRWFFKDCSADWPC